MKGFNELVACFSDPHFHLTQLHALDFFNVRVVETQILWIYATPPLPSGTGQCDQNLNEHIHLIPWRPKTWNINVYVNLTLDLKCTRASEGNL